LKFFLVRKIFSNGMMCCGKTRV